MKAFYHDISPVLWQGTAVYPGDTPFSREVNLSFDQGNHLLLSAVQHTLHIGSHADAPNHYHPDGKGIDQRSLHYYMGPCQVITLNLKPGQRIVPEHLQGTEIQAKRVLFRTDSFIDRQSWKPDYNSLSPELIDFLAKAAVILVGIDTPSVDPDDSKGLESHQAIFRRDMAILEGLDLRQVQEGLYTLISLPLKYKDADASPVRAVLINDLKALERDE